MKEVAPFRVQSDRAPVLDFGSLTVEDKTGINGRDSEHLMKFVDVDTLLAIVKRGD